VRLAFLTIALVGSAAHAERAKPPAPPCAGCVLEVPRTDKPVPLLVVLHGDREQASVAAARWRAAARARGWALLALQCPKSEGCKDSWWQWNGDPAYVDAQVAKLAEAIAIDPAHVALAGWSGGGTYIGLRAQAWPARFSGVVIHGGGMAPAESACPARALPAYFLLGDRNPLHRLAVELRAYFDRCKQPIVWDVLRGGEHDREHRALDAKKGVTILDWLHARPRSGS
jgi:poly(3-hydroxybutyrate) depolymerase